MKQAHTSAQWDDAGFVPTFLVASLAAVVVWAAVLFSGVLQPVHQSPIPVSQETITADLASGALTLGK
jgi:hypothetical protein